MSVPGFDNENQKPDSRKCILQAAAKLFSRMGLSKTSIRDIARESKLNISMVSYYFGGKEGLYKELMQSFAKEIQSDMRERLDHLQKQQMSKELFVSQIKIMLEKMILMNQKYPEICQILAREKLEGMPLSKEVHQNIFYPLVRRFYQVVESAKAAGVVKADVDPAVFYIVLSEGLFNFFNWMHFENNFQKDCESFYKNKDLLIQQITTIYLSGALNEESK